MLLTSISLFAFSLGVPAAPSTLPSTQSASTLNSELAAAVESAQRVIRNPASATRPARNTLEKQERDQAKEENPLPIIAKSLEQKPGLISFRVSDVRLNNSAILLPQILVGMPK